jgi:uncharacterized ion transporter superfamily protein YfcC
MKVILAVMMVVLSFGATAGKYDFTIKSLGISEGSYTLFIDTNETHTLSECSEKSSFRYVINKESSLYREIYSGIMAAQMADKTVEIAFTDAATDCLYNSPQILSISIK